MIKMCEDCIELKKDVKIIKKRMNWLKKQIRIVKEEVDCNLESELDFFDGFVYRDW